MTTQLNLGETDEGIATIAIAANLAVKWDTTAGQIVVCGIGDIPIGYTQDAIAAVAVGTFYRAGRGNRVNVTTTSTPSAGDYLKCGAAGVLVPEATASTPTLFTVAQASAAADTNGNLLATTTR